MSLRNLALASALLISSGIAFANASMDSNSESGDASLVRFECSQYNFDTGAEMKGRVYLTQTEKGGKLVDGSAKKFTLEYVDDVTLEKPVVVKTGVAKQDDVIVFFKSDDARYTFTIYLDELDQSVLKIDRKRVGMYKCVELQ